MSPFVYECHDQKVLHNKRYPVCVVVYTKYTSYTLYRQWTLYLVNMYNYPSQTVKGQSYTQKVCYSNLYACKIDKLNVDLSADYLKGQKSRIEMKTRQL